MIVQVLFVVIAVQIVCLTALAFWCVASHRKTKRPPTPEPIGKLYGIYKAVDESDDAYQARCNAYFGVKP